MKNKSFDSFFASPLRVIPFQYSLMEELDFTEEDCEVLTTFL